ncbi:MAG: hypothetical protein PHC92_07120 [Syntrophomonadaceae bacterium]|nr:hypothetical protein [Syntrophomonadaceae bacterium]MDD3022659.1 hypothetical protein [Syntrophomonadaceae bacterium]
MQDLSWNCNVCEACGVCGRSEAECNIYHEYYELEEGRPAKKSSSDNAVSILEKTETRAPKVQWSIEANMGLINRLSGRITSVVEGEEMAILTIKSGDNKISSMMSLKRFMESGKKVGDIVTLVFKASNVKLMK